MESYLTPSEAQIAELMQGDHDAPVAALNLFWFSEQAQYQPEDPEYGTDAANLLLSIGRVTSGVTKKTIVSVILVKDRKSLP